MKREFYLDQDSNDWSASSYNEMEPLKKKKRVRARLDHMTPQEKQERRKEKNRQAAQTARDRKREKLERLEEENQRLREENKRLRSAILGNSREQSIVDCNPISTQDQLQQSQPQLLQLQLQFASNHTPTPPALPNHDSGVSDVDSKSATSLSTSYAADDNNSNSNNNHNHNHNHNSNNNININHQMDRLDSSSNYVASTGSPTPSDDQLINSIIERDNDIALVNEVQKLVSYANGDTGDDVSIEAAVSINELQQRVQDTSIGSPSTENSLGWTSIQLMLILLISRIHHRLSAKTNCCQREQMKSSCELDELDPINCNLYDYILHTKCVNFRRAADAIISNKNNVRQQRLVALDFVQKYLYHTNLTLQVHNNGQAQRSCLVKE